MPNKPRKLSIFNGITITGFAISLFIGLILAFVPTFLNADKPAAIIICLIGIVVTLLIDFNEKLKDIANANQLAEHLRQDPELAPKLEKILDDGIKVKQSKADIFIKRMYSSLDNCSSVIHELSEGQSTPDSLSPIFRLNGAFSQGRRTIYIVQGLNPASSIEGVFGTRYLEALREGYNNYRITIKIIWLQPKDILIKYKDRILNQAKTIAGKDPLGEHVRVIEPSDNMDPKYIDFGLIDDEIVYFPQQDKGLDNKVERILITKVEIDNAKAHFERLWSSLATPVDEYFMLLGLLQPSPPPQPTPQLSPPTPINQQTTTNPPTTH